MLLSATGPGIIEVPASFVPLAITSAQRARPAAAYMPLCVGAIDEIAVVLCCSSVLPGPARCKYRRIGRERPGIDRGCEDPRGGPR